MTRIIALALLCASMSATPAAASDDNTVQYLYDRCGGSDTVWTAWCLGYVRGVVDAIDLQSYVDNRTLCDAMTAEQIRRLFVRWADLNPQYWQSPASSGVAAAIHDAGMCS